MRRAFKNMAFYLILVCFLWVGLATMAHLLFGHSVKTFSSIGWSFMTIFSIFCGHFDYTDMKKADSDLAPIFFSFIMVITVFVLLNLFIAILEDAYSRVKSKHAATYDERDVDNKLEFFSSLKTFFTWC